MLRGIHLAFSATCGGDPWGWSSRRSDRGGLQRLLTRGTRGLMGEASKRFRSARALTRGWNWGGWRVPVCPAFVGPDHMISDAEAHENDARPTDQKRGPIPWQRPFTAGGVMGLPYRIFSLQN